MAAKKQTKKAGNKSKYIGEKFFLTTEENTFNTLDRQPKDKEVCVDVWQVIPENLLENGDIVIEVEIKAIHKVEMKAEYKEI